MAGQGATYNSFSNGLFPVGKTKVEAIIIIALCTPLSLTAQVCVFHLSLHNINPFLATSHKGSNPIQIMFRKPQQQ